MWPFDGNDQPERDPNDPNTWTGQERADFLSRAGYQWLSGNGPEAFWRAPDGTTVAEGNAFSQISSGEIPTSPTTKVPSQDFSPNVGVNRATGRPEYFTLQGGKAVFTGVEPQAAAGGGTGMAQVGLGYAQLEQTKANAAEAQRQFDLKFNSDMQRNQQDSALAYATLDFNKQKEAFAQSQDNQRLAMQATQLQQDSQLKIANLQMQQQQMQISRDQFNTQMAFQVQKANQEFQAQARADLAQAGRDIAQYASNPTDYGKLAAYLTANQKFGGPATQITGKDFTSETSLAPLGAGLKAAQEAQARTTQNPYSFTPLAALQTGGGNPPVNQDALARANAMAAAINQQSAQPAQQAPSPYAQINAIAQQQGATGTNFSGFNAAGNAQPGIGGFAKGGVAQGAYVSGEKGPELNVPLGKGKAIVFNQDQMDAMGLNLKRIMKMAEGGVFSSGTAITGGAAPNTTDPRQFLDESFARAVKDLPGAWTGGARGGRDSLPSAVFASSPGTSPIVTQFLGGLSQMAGLLPAEEYARQAALIAPTGIRETNIRRTG